MTEKELILTHLMGCSRSDIYFNLNIDRDINLKLNKIIEKRKKGLPLQYLLGKTNFMGFDFKVDKRVLIPRFETEILVEKTIDIIRGLKFKDFTMLDICTGSGCVAIAIARFFKTVKISASDISSDAISLAKENALLNDVNLQIKFIKSDLFQKLKNKRYNIITCNPPYIPTDEFKNLASEISYEPRLALCGGDDGLIFYRRILKDVHLYLEKKGFFIFEIGCNNTGKIINLINNNSNLKLVEIIKDYNNLDRVVIVKNG